MSKKTGIFNRNEWPEAFCDNMTVCIDEGRGVDVIYLDLIGAFDAISP